MSGVEESAVVSRKGRVARWVALGAVALACCGVAVGTVSAPQEVLAQAVPSPGAAVRGGAGIAPRAPSAAANATAASVEGVVNVNSAGEEELVRLPGVGPARAAAIVALRARLQRFRAPEDLLRVRGIGRAGFRRMRPYVTLASETTLEMRPGRTPRAEQ